MNNDRKKLVGCLLLFGSYFIVANASVFHLMDKLSNMLFLILVVSFSGLYGIAILLTNIGKNINSTFPLTVRKVYGNVLLIVSLLFLYVLPFINIDLVDREKALENIIRMIFGLTVCLISGVILVIDSNDDNVGSLAIVLFLLLSNAYYVFTHILEIKLYSYLIIIIAIAYFIYALFYSFSILVRHKR